MTLFADQDIELIIQHIRKPQYVIPLDPMPTPRPRFSIGWKSFTSILGKNVTISDNLVKYIKTLAFSLAYNDKKYSNYKKNLIFLIRTLKPRIQPDKYRRLVVVFYWRYPVGTPKKNMVEGSPFQKRPDFDNCVKAICDALQDAHILMDDGLISDACVFKRYTTEKQGRIEFSLLK